MTGRGLTLAIFLAGLCLASPDPVLARGQAPQPASEDPKADSDETPEADTPQADPGEEPESTSDEKEKPDAEDPKADPDEEKKTKPAPPEPKTGSEDEKKPGQDKPKSTAEDEKALEAARKAVAEAAKKAEAERKAALAKQLRDAEITEEVKVTATRVETTLMKTPIAVSAFEQDTLDREGIKDVEDIANYVPNLDIATKNGQSTPIISLRGVRSENETELGDPSVGVHLDGIYSPRMQGILALMFDNERVEVLRGPQGTLFGRNSTVGSINIITAKPKLDRQESRMSLSYGNFNAPEISGMVNYPISEEFAVRVAGRYHQRDSFIDGYWDPNQYDQRHLQGLVGDPRVISDGSFDGSGNRTCTDPACYTRTQHSNWWIDEVNPNPGVRALVPADREDFYLNAKEWAYRVSGLWEPKDKNYSLNLMYQQFKSDSAGGVDLVNCEKLRGRPNYGAVFDEDENSPSFGELIGFVKIGTNDCGEMFPEDDPYQAVVNVPGKIDLDIQYVRSQFTWDIKDNLRFIASGGYEDQDRESAQDMEQSLNAWDQAMFFLPGTGSNSWMGELQLQSTGNQRLNWITGANVFHETTATFGYFDNPLGERSMWWQPDRSTNASAIFAQGTLTLTDEWFLSLGYRYSDETKQDVGGRTFTCTPLNRCAPGDRARDQLNSLPADYFADPSVYTSVSRNDNRGSWDHHDWRIGLDYDKDNTLLYTYLATGFKAGGIGDVFNEFDPKTQEEINVRTSFEPEEVVTLEVGFKQKFPKSKLNLAVNYFHTDYQDMQYASVGAIAFTHRYDVWRDQFDNLLRHPNCPDGTPPDFPGTLCFDFIPTPIIAYFTQNVPGAEIQGIELEYDWRPWKGGRITGYATWLDTKITEDWITKWDYDPVSYFGLNFADAVDPTNEALTVNLRGNELPVSPPYSLHFTIDHSFSLSKADMAIVPWITAHWEDDAYMTVWNVEKHTDDLDFVIRDEDIRYTDDHRKAWTMFHAGVRVYSGKITAELYGYNLTDEVIQWWGGAAEQVPKGSLSMPRTYGLRFGYEF